TPNPVTSSQRIVWARNSEHIVNPSGVSRRYEAFGSMQISETNKQSPKNTMPSQANISRERTIQIPIRTNASEPSATTSHLLGFEGRRIGSFVCTESRLTVRLQPRRAAQAAILDWPHHCHPQS